MRYVIALLLLTTTLPAKGSHWILFLHQGDGLWLTYRGDFGRKAATPELVGKVPKMT